MNIHILTGDALLETFRAAEIEGNVLISRECLIDGPVASPNLADFWKMRSRYIAAEYGAEEARYDKEVSAEYEKILNLSTEDEVHLWFEYDLFCQVNLWFILSLLNRSSFNGLYRVEPAVRKKGDLWKGFAGLPKGDIKKCFERRVKLSKDDVLLGEGLWEAFRTGDLKKLAELSRTESIGLPHLPEVCIAEIQRKVNRRPEKTLRRLLDEGITDFKTIFERFSAAEGIYGFGDLQVRSMYRRIVSARDDAV